MACVKYNNIILLLGEHTNLEAQKKYEEYTQQASSEILAAILRVYNSDINTIKLSR